MNHCVPDFHEMEDDDSIPTHSSFSRQKRPPTGEEEIMELLWQNGQVVVQSQNQRPSKKSAFGSSGEVVLPTEREIRSTAEEQPPHLFMQEDEMVSWLQYPLDDSSFDRDFYTDLLYSAPPPPALVPPTAQPRAVAEIRPPPPPPPPPRPPIQPPVARPDNPPRVHNFVHFSRLPIRPRTEAVSSVSTARESTIVDSNETPAVRPESRVSHMVADGTPPLNEDSATAKGGSTSAAAGDLTAGTCDLTLTSSPGGSRTSFSEATRQPHQKPPAAAAEDRKRKAREADDTEYQNEDIKFEAKKQARGSASTKRSRAAEVHNLSERRRRDRINEKMRALQELIPHCNKSDKASMLDEAIEYLKSLQLQVQMMSMGCGMVPMIYTGMQPYMPAMGLGMGMEMAMNRPMVPYPSMMPGSAAAAAAHMPPRFPLPPFHMPSTNQLDNSITPHNQNQPRLPNYADPYQEYHLGFHHRQLPVPHNQGVVQPNADKPSTSKDIDNPDNHPTG